MKLKLLVLTGVLLAVAAFSAAAQNTGAGAVEVEDDIPVEALRAIVGLDEDATADLADMVASHEEAIAELAEMIVNNMEV